MVSSLVRSVRPASRLKNGGRLTFVVFLLAAILQPTANAQTTRKDVDRLVGIALMTDWVVANCGAEELSGMLLLTMSGTLKQLTPDALKIGRKRVADRAARFGSKAAACADFRAGLIAIQ